MLDKASAAAKKHSTDLEADEEPEEAPEEQSEVLTQIRAVGFAGFFFYAAYYAMAGIFSGALGTEFTGLEPFEHENFRPAVDSADLRPLVTWLSMVLTFCLFGPWITYFSVRDSERAVDNATAIQGLHVFLSTTATQVFPQNWVWWATLMPCMLFHGRMAQFMLMKFGFRLCVRGFRPISPAPPAPLRAARAETASRVDQATSTARIELAAVASTTRAVARARVLYPFEGQAPGDLTLPKAGDVVDVLDKEKPGQGWWTGRVGRREGIFPENYVETIVGQ